MPCSVSWWVFLVPVNNHFDSTVLRAAGDGIVRRDEAARALGLQRQPGRQRRMPLVQVIANREGARQSQFFVECQWASAVGAAEDRDTARQAQVTFCVVQLGLGGGAQLCASETELHDDGA